MNKFSIILLQIVIILIGIAALAFLLYEPHIEGRNANATFFEIYFNDLFLAYVYIASIPFFVVIYKAFRVLGFAGQNKIFSQEAVKDLQIIKYCAAALICFAAVGEIFIFMSESDDRAGGVFMGILVIFGSVIIAASANIFERILQRGINKICTRQQINTNFKNKL